MAALALVLGVAFAGVSVLIIGMALFADPMVEVSHLENGFAQTERVFNHYVAHKQEMALIASGIGFLTGVLMIGFSGMSIRITRALAVPAGR
jgi:hypothetical protein